MIKSEINLPVCFRDSLQLQSKIRMLLVWSLLLFALILATGTASAADPYEVVWDTPGNNFKDSMPAGNGDLGINLWTETNGDLVFLISKTDAWTENGQLVKLGRVRVKLDPSPFVASQDFHQTLKPTAGEIEIQGKDSTVMHVWVDANRPVIHLELKSGQPVSLQAGVELWRTESRTTLSVKGNDEMLRGLRELNGDPSGGVVIEPDTILPAKGNRLTWFHHNTRSIYSGVFETQHLQPLLAKYPDPLLYRTFGVTMKGPGLVSVDDQTLKSAGSQKDFRLDLYALTSQSEQVRQWRSALGRTVDAADSIDLETARQAHLQWWRDFWNRSWVRVSGDADAEKVTQGYAMQRWMVAAGGRGAMPVKFNGGIFTVGQEPPSGVLYNPTNGQLNADYRAWGGNFWFQNQRLLYWPMIANGDFDTLAPFFKMYSAALPLAKDRTELIYHHPGAMFPETIFFWGLPNNNDYGWHNPGPDMQSHWIRWHFNGGLELVAMLLDTYDTTQDENFARQTLVPIASGIITWFDQHWKRSDGKIHFEPSAALETRQSAVNPTPDIAGLKSNLPRLLALPRKFTTPEQRESWSRLLAEVPPVPRGQTDAGGRSPQTSENSSTNGVEIIWPAEKFAKPGNSENPELYAVHPYRLFGVGLPELELARATYDAKLFKDSTCWGQQGIQAACLGWADRAKKEAVANFTAYGSERFKWFWKPGHDYEPDLDNGGAGQIILQNMIFQVRGEKILLLPAWPKEWNVDFKLNAPEQTTIEGTYRDGKFEELKITPASRKKDVIIP